MGYFACAQYDILFLYVILNDSEESHRVSEEYIFYGKPPSREIASLRSQRQYIRLVDSSVGYFACAQYDVLVLYVILNDSEESHRVSEEYIFYGKPPSREIASLRSQRQYIRLVDSSVGYFANAQYDVFVFADCRGTSCLVKTMHAR